MSLEQTLKTSIGRIRGGRLANEAQVKSAVILPILRELGWDDADPEMFKPEYSVKRGFVDYALLDRGSPLIFIEAKRIGALDTKGEGQLFRYAAHKGVPLLVLTDGNYWDFYLSMASGDPAKRRFYQLKLDLEDKITEYTDFLEKHLRRDRVVSGEARRNAEKRLESNREREKALGAIPGAWQSLLREPNEVIRNLLVAISWEVKRKDRIEPELDDVKAFLESLRPNPKGSLKPNSRRSLGFNPKESSKPNPKGSLRPNPKESSEPSPKFQPSASTTSLPKSSRPKRIKIVGFVFRGEKFETRSSNATLAEILKIFQRENSEFMDRFAAKTTSKTRNLVSRNRSNLYQKPHLMVYSKELGNGWWLGTNLGTQKIRKYIETACTDAGIKFGTELVLIER